MHITEEKNLKVFIYILIFCVVFILFIVLESIREHKIFKVKKYEISNEKIPEAFKNTRIIMLSDVHNTFYGVENERVLNTIREINPDFIILAGDIPVANTKHGKLNLKAAKFVTELSEITDVYYGLGNHEERMIEKDLLKDDWDNYYKIISSYRGSHKIIFMNNNKLSVKKNRESINIYGLNLELKYYQRFSNCILNPEDITDKLGELNKDKYNILIAHNPDYFESYVGYGADLILSGHVHGGMVRLPLIGGVVSPKPRLFPHYDYGLYVKNNSTMILSNGLGSHSVKLRINNVPEMVVIEFT